MLRVLTSGFGFVILLIVLMILAYWDPSVGTRGGWLYHSLLSEFLVGLIFVIQGSRLSLKNLSFFFRQPVGGFALQAGIVFLPVLWVKIFWVAGIIPDNFYPTFFFLAILPTTISSCVVFTASVQGNADYSLGHATLSNLMALFLVPVLWAGSYEERVAFDILVPKIIALVVLPSLAGWLLSKLFSRIAPRIQGKWHEQIPMLCIAFLVYLSLCEGISQTGGIRFLSEVKLILPYCVGFVILLHLSGWMFSIRWSKSRDIQIAQFFCLSQKSLASGMPLATVIFFGSTEELMGVTLPLFCVHFLQLLLGSSLLIGLKPKVDNQ